MDDFNNAFIQKVKDEIERRVIERADKITITFHGIVSVLTPVDTGQARAGWSIFLNKKLSRMPKPLSANQKKSKKVIPANKSEITQNAKKIGDRYFVTNPVNHIVYLDQGSSSQRGSDYIKNGLIIAIKQVGES